MESQNPGKTPYHYASNNPINRVDPSGGQDDENKENQDGTGKDQENKQKKELEDYKHQNKQAQQEYEENFETLPRKEMDTDLSGKGQGENMEGPSTIEAAKISKDVYEGSNVARKGGWEKVNPNDIEGVDFKNKETGFNSALYVRKNDAEKKEYVYAFAGTTNVQDWKENIEQGLGHSEQYRTAVENAKELKQQLDGNITFVGHSLGGGLASAAAKAMGEDAITFNPAGLSGKTKDNLNLNKKADIEAYIVKGEILNQKQPFKAEGNINKIDPPEPYTTFKEYKSKFTKVGQALMGSKLYKGYQSIKLNESIKNHSMNNVIKSLKKAGY